LKLGSENRTKTIVAGVLMAIALLVVLNALWGNSPSPASSAGAAAATPAMPTPAAIKRGGKKPATARSLDPTLRYDWLKASEAKKYEGNSRNIFRAEADIPQPVAPVAAEQQPQSQQPTGPAPPPPINLKFFGFANKVGEARKVFLSQGEDVFIAREGDIVDRRYRIVHITPTSVEIEDVINNNRQSIPLTQG
jgi:hypothetical protein